MVTYLMLFSFTQKGLENIKECPARVLASKQIVRQMGGDVQVFYAILGSQYDTMFVVRAPSDEAVAEMVLAIGSRGNVRTQTHRLFNEDEFSKIVTSLP